MSANPPYGCDYTSLAPPLFATPFLTAASGLISDQQLSHHNPFIQGLSEESRRQ